MADTKYSKDNLKGFVPVEVAGGIMDEIARGSAVLQLSDVKPMKSDTMKFQVWADKPGAYWVGEGERINTSKASWIFPEMQAKKIAVIIPPLTKSKRDFISPFRKAFPKALPILDTTFPIIAPTLTIPNPRFFINSHTLERIFLKVSNPDDSNFPFI